MRARSRALPISLSRSQARRSSLSRASRAADCRSSSDCRRLCGAASARRTPRNAPASMARPAPPEKSTAERQQTRKAAARGMREERNGVRQTSAASEKTAVMDGSAPHVRSSASPQAAAVRSASAPESARKTAPEARTALSGTPPGRRTALHPASRNSASRPRAERLFSCSAAEKTAVQTASSKSRAQKNTISRPCAPSDSRPSVPIST